MPCSFSAWITLSFPAPDGAERTKRSPCSGAGGLRSCWGTVCSVSSCMFIPHATGTSESELVYASLLFCYTDIIYSCSHWLNHYNHNTPENLLLGGRNKMPCYND